MSGYEKIANFMTGHHEMAMFQRFNFLNTLNILHLQAELVHLELDLKEYMTNDFRTAESLASDSESQGNTHNDDSEHQVILGMEMQQIPQVMDQDDGNGNIAGAIYVPGNDEQAGGRLPANTSEPIASVMPANGSQLGLSLPSAETPHQEAAQSSASNVSSNAWAAVLNVGENTRVETASTASHGNPALDWWDLANVEENSKVWKLMLKAREKLKEYSKSLTLAHFSINSNTTTDETIHLQLQLNASASPHKDDLDFVRRWLKDPHMGMHPIIGRDNTLWETSTPSDLIVLSPLEAPDPLSAFFLRRVSLAWLKLLDWWYQTPKHPTSQRARFWGLVGRNVKTPVDEEANYFEFKDATFVRAADALGSLIASLLLVVSILVLYLVTSIPVRLGIVAIFTTIFSLSLVLIISARKMEVFAGTTA